MNKTLEYELPHLTHEEADRLRRYQGDPAFFPLDELRKRKTLNVIRTIAITTGASVLAVTLPQLVRDLLK